MAKPDDWEQMSNREKDALARELFNNTRGHFIIARALAVAIEQLREEERPTLSDIDDMELIVERLFPHEWARLAQPH